MLVLGAGASNPYGFPLGADLKNSIVATQKPMLEHELRVLHYDNATITEFRDALRYGSHATIDIFLERKTNFREIGAYFIAEAISRCESHDALFSRQDWYADLFRLLGLETLGGEMPDVSIVTLNYDRSLEHFLAKNIDYNCPHELVERAHERRKSLKIVHAHGSLGPYPETMYGSASGHSESLRRAAESIRIVSDRLDESPDFRAAQGLVAQAKHVVFLGFGYNDRTLLALLSGVDREQTQFYGTAMNLSGESKQSVSEFFHNNIILGPVNQGSAAFLKDTLLQTRL